MCCSRRRLDDELAAGIDPATKPALALRAAQVVAPAHRLKLAIAVERLVDESASPRPFTAAIPIVRDQVAEARGSLLFLAYLLRSADRVKWRGVAMVEQLLGDGGSVLYVRGARGALLLQLQAALDCLVGEQLASPEAWFATSPASKGQLDGSP